MESFPFTTTEPARNEDIAVGTTAVTVSESRVHQSQNRRKVISVRNTSTSATANIRVFLGSQGVATTSAGILLKQYESFTDANEAGYECVQDKITAISSEANATLSVFER